MSQQDTTAYCMLIEALAKELALEGFTPPVDGNFALEAGSLALSITLLGDQVMIYAPVGNLPEDEAEAKRLCRLFLNANTLLQGTGGATLGVAQEGDVISLCRLIPLRGTEVGWFLTVVEQFVDALADWMEALEAPAPQKSKAEGAAANASQPMPWNRA